MLTTSKLATHLKVGTHGSTYGGNPLACAVAEAVVDVVSQPETLAGVKEREAMFRDGLAKINDKYQIFSEVRGKGLLLGAALNEAWQGRARDVLVAAGEQGDGTGCGHKRGSFRQCWLSLHKKLKKVYQN